MSKTAATGSFVLIALVATGAAAQSTLRLGAEFQVNAYTSSIQFTPAVARASNGTFVVAWASYGQDGSYYGVFARRFDAAGVPQAGDLQVSGFTVGQQFDPALAADAAGGFVVVWSAALDGSGSSVSAQRFDVSGQRLGGEFLVNAYTSGSQSNPAIARDSDGDFVVVFESEGQDGSAGGVFARRFDSAGSPKGTDFQVNSYTMFAQQNPVVGIDADGDFVVAWQSIGGQDGSSTGVFARRFASAGTALGTEFQVNAWSTNAQTFPAIDLDAGGRFVVVWQSYLQEGSDYGVFGRRFGSGGSPIGIEFQVNLYTASGQRRPVIAIEDAGDFVVAWQSNFQDGNSYGVFGRAFTAAGSAQGVEFQINSSTVNGGAAPAIGIDAAGNFVAAWTSFVQDGSQNGIFAQRFTTRLLDVDGDDTVTPLTDGLLVLRHEFGFTGPSLTSNAVGSGCTRCSADDIEDYLLALGSTLDVDNEGMISPLTDGLLVLRFLFGFTGSTLTDGALTHLCLQMPAPPPLRCQAATIETYLAGLL